MGYKVEKLDRMWYAGLDKRGLKRGDWRHLNEKELTSIKKMVKLK
jgi:23S rRNA pseudouridine2605 synthase